MGRMEYLRDEVANVVGLEVIRGSNKVYKHEVDETDGV